MKALQATFALLTTSGFGKPVPEAGPACRVLPGFAALRARVDKMPGAEALPLLYGYAADPANDNPDACEGIALDGLITARERTLVSIVADGATSHPAAIYHCGSFDKRTTACDGSVTDLTANPDRAEIVRLSAN